MNKPSLKGASLMKSMKEIIKGISESEKKIIVRSSLCGHVILMDFVKTEK